MKNKAQQVSRYNFTAGELILPDANIWLLLYSPATQALPARRQAQIATYSAAWSDLYTAGASVCLDPLVMCEVVNRLLHDEWMRLDPRRFYRNRKDFRDNSPNYRTAAQAVEATSRLIVADSQALEHSFKNWDLDALLAEFGSAFKDWNDQLIVENCRHHKCKLLTDDADHTEGGIQVLTENLRLVNACP